MSEHKITHDERMRLAETLVERLVDQCGDVVVAGVYGSAARGTDTPHSDLDLLVVRREVETCHQKHYLYRGTAVGIEVMPEDALVELLVHPSLKWPYWMGVLSALKLLYGDRMQVQLWLNLGRDIPIERFHTVLEAELPGLVIESYGRILSGKQRHNRTDLYASVIEVILEMNLALCLLNGSWVTHDYYQGVVDATRFLKLPQDYAGLALTLWRATDMDEIVSLSETLVNNFWRLLKAEGIRVDDYQTPDEIPL